MPIFNPKYDEYKEDAKECDEYPENNTSDAFLLFLILILLLLSGITISHLKAKKLEKMDDD